MDRWMGGWIDGQMDGRINGWVVWEMVMGVVSDSGGGGGGRCVGYGCS